MMSRLAHEGPNRHAMLNATGFLDTVAGLLRHENACMCPAAPAC